jgi:uridine phosphorylase
VLEHEFPILEYDDSPRAVLEPPSAREGRELPECGVGCFQQHCVDALVSELGAESTHHLGSNLGKHPIYQIDCGGRRIALFVPGLGAPFAAAFLEEVIALGCRKMIFIGTCGVLADGLPRGSLIVPTSAVRDEGTSYRYLPPGREAVPSSRVVQMIANALQAKGHPHVLGKTWTTDGIYRETLPRLGRRRAEGCMAVEMEAAALFAVAQFRGAEMGMILYGADDLSGEAWDSRADHPPITSDHDLLKLAMEVAATL